MSSVEKTRYIIEFFEEYSKWKLNSKRMEILSKFIKTLNVNDKERFLRLKQLRLKEKTIKKMLN